MNAYHIMREWDQEAGLQPRTDAQMDQDVPASLPIDYRTFKCGLESDDAAAIIAGRTIGWGLTAIV